MSDDEEGCVIASPLTERQTSVTCSSSKQTPKCCQILVPVNILGKTVDIGVGCFLINILNVCTGLNGGDSGGGGGESTGGGG
ncbi:hypothetical protein N7466_006055 [Penicillium verhagenii]|uniref:uncharacterized protein n=1 Tax=Penicillium verhagenii TaxID=1562060 RepID=UPI0025451710|nr:uncharacterized protein N7466_006055 [Penicillium verhagenii]KAJ5930562.1 hypothetical protein N7466_006055 [Penicillium verhagenii]